MMKSLLIGIAILAGTGASRASAAEIELRGGIYSIDKFLDYVMDEHPKVDGPVYGAAILFGDRGEVVNHRVSLDYASASGEGKWRREKDSGSGKVEFEFASLSYAAIFNIMPSWRVNPYIGIGAGVGYGKASASGNLESTSIGGSTSGKSYIPVIVVPAGIRVKASDRIALAVEGGFLDGLYVTGNLRFAF
ncbi:MAG: hypothetical protein HY039_00960 [Nitrospirae bacterium]|nr:hypothetical protein [Nitrospirota bacterium]